MFGYRKHGDGSYRPDRRTGPILAELYRRSVRGTAFAELARWLNRNRIATASGSRAAWTAQGVARLLDGGFAAGFVTHDGQVKPGAHQPLILPELWAAYRARRQAGR